MDRVVPSIEELAMEVSEQNSGDVLLEYTPFFELMRIQAQAMLHICLELEQINNNLEALRGNDSHKGRIGWLDMQGVWHDGLMPLEGDDAR